ncbi:MAG: hypothetical protein ACJ8C4_20275 [Gemmataceae bacterium]
MTRRWLRPMTLIAALWALSGSGCLFWFPQQAWVAERMDDKYQHPNDFRTPILPPIRDGFPLPICEDPPTDLEVLRTMPRMSRGIPFVYEEFRDDIEIVPERIVDKIDPPRFYPLVGPAQLHHCHWKCTIYYKDTRLASQPIAAKIVKDRVQVVYIDKDHLHLWVGPNPAAQAAVSRDLGGY